jgi:hypothetical protein
VPSTQQRPALPPVDPEADALIAQLFQQYPEARYRITQAAFVQEAALVEAQNRIRQLEWERDNARAQAQQPQRGGGFLGGLFGGGSQPRPQPMSPPPQPQYPPGYNPQMLAPQRGGSGFLGTALAGAAGVAGGMVLGNALVNMFSHHGHGGISDATAASSGGLFGGGSSPWSDPGAAAASQGWDAGGGAKDPGFDDKFAGSPPDATPTNWGGYGGDDASSGGYDDNTRYDDNSGGGGGDYGGDDFSSNDC